MHNMAKMIKFDTKAREKLKTGVDTLADAVSDPWTQGPQCGY